MDLALHEVNTTHSYQQVPVRGFRLSRFLHRFCSRVLLSDWRSLCFCTSLYILSHPGFSIMYKRSSLWLSPIHPPPSFQNLPPGSSFPPALIPACFPSISTFFHSYHLLPNLILPVSFCTYLFLLLIFPPGDTRRTLLLSNSTFCSPSENKKKVFISVCEKERDLIHVCLYLCLTTKFESKIWHIAALPPHISPQQR